MKKICSLICLGLLSALTSVAQSPLRANEGLQKQTLQLCAPMKGNLSKVVQPLPSNSLFVFDSLNVSYKGSWGLGQSFSIGSNSAGTIEFVGSGAGVIILDVTNPASPVKLSEISTRGLVDAIYFEEATQRLYVTAYFAGFEIWDLSNISAPVKIGGGSTTGLPRGGIYAGGNYVYVVTVIDGVQIFDISTPSSPVNVGNCPLDPSNLCWTSAKSGNLIFAALSEGGMLVVDVSDPASPFVAGTYPDAVYGVGVANGYAYTVSYSYGLNILDISDLSNITLVGNCPIDGFPLRVQVKGNTAYLGNTGSGSGGGINVVDVATAANPQFITTYPAYAEHIAAGGNVLGFTGSSLPCTILDISVPTAPVLAYTYPLPIMTLDVFVNGNYAYTGNNGFRVFDISDKTHPEQVGYNSHDGAIVRTTGTNAVYIRESMTSNNPVMLMDISDPTNPTFLGQYMAPVMTNDLELKDNYAFVACWWDGVRVVNFQNPAHPVLSAHVMGWTSSGTPGVTYCYVQALDIEGNYLYLIDYGPFPAEDTRGLYIMDISDPVHPTLIKRFTDFASYGYDIDAVGNFVYIADNYGGVEVVDVTDKANPVTRGYVGLPDGANAIKVTENQAFVADYINGGVQVVDVSDPDNPAISGYYTRSGCFALGVDVKGNDIYLADGAGGFQIYNTNLVTGINKEPLTSGLESFAYPNPFTNQVRIKTGTNTDPGNMLKIYDTGGRTVTLLMPVINSSSGNIYEWNGKSALGVSVEPGFYYYKTASGKTSGKIIKIR